MMTYEELLECRVYDAIKSKVADIDISDCKDFDDLLVKYDSPANTSHHPLLLDYDWVYEHAEELFVRNCYEFQQHQGVEEYYLLFKVLTEKYSLEEDNKKIKVADKNTKWHLEIKWSLFLSKMIEFFNADYKDVFLQLLEKEKFLNYFLKYSNFYTPAEMERAGNLWIERMLSYDNFSSYYTDDYKKLIHLIKKHLNLKIPDNVMNNKKVITSLTHNPNIEEFYYELYYISEQTDIRPYLEEHKNFCDEQIKNIKDGILPCLFYEYNNDNDFISVNTKCDSNLLNQVKQRIFELKKVAKLPKREYYLELSKYYIVGMFISRYFMRDPYNMLIDIETLYSFVIEYDRNLTGFNIYDFLTHFETKNVFETIDFYNSIDKNISLKEVFDNDWQTQKNMFINELNDSLLDKNNLSKTKIDNVECYDITNIDSPYLVHNTSVCYTQKNAIDHIIDDITNPYKKMLSLSLQDYKHQTFYSSYCNVNDQIKLIYGKIDFNRVGIVCHSDAYSISLNESEDSDYINRLYTLKSFLEYTDRFNEITYSIDGITLIPYGILCENTIKKEEVELAKILGCTIFFRKENKKIYSRSSLTAPVKKYTYAIDKKLF